MFGIKKDGQYFGGSDAVQESNISQAIHCEQIIDDSCQALTKALGEGDATAERNDNVQFREDGKNGRSCKWV
jgi:hypothetical protein